jgi:hypothetical protein
LLVEDRHLAIEHAARCAACCGIGACAVPPTIE